MSDEPQDVPPPRRGPKDPHLDPPQSPAQAMCCGTQGPVHLTGCPPSSHPTPGPCGWGLMGPCGGGAGVPWPSGLGLEGPWFVLVSGDVLSVSSPGARRTDERILNLQTLAHRPSLFGKNRFQANIC